MLSDVSHCKWTQFKIGRILKCWTGDFRAYMHLKACLSKAYICIYLGLGLSHDTLANETVHRPVHELDEEIKF